MITYKLLGQQGALGNQLWEIAGTFGKAGDDDTKPLFPLWFYQPYFNVPREFFRSGWSNLPDDATDLGEDYLQDLGHWYPRYERQIRDMFSPSIKSMDMLTDAYDGEDLSFYTAVHVRRGNNVTARYAPFHPACPVQYFEEALDKMSGPVMVFSDDPEWCKEQSIFRDAQYALGPPANIDIMDLTKYGPKGTVNAAIDLLAMGLCGQHIISNSSFSWWGAFLADTGRVIYPSRWYGEPLGHIDTTPMFEGLDWEKIQFEEAWDGIV